MKAFETTIAESADSLAGPWRRPHQMLHAQTYDSHASIHDEDAGTEVNQPMGERAADEPETAGDHYSAVAIKRAIVDAARRQPRVHRFNDSGGTVELIVGLRKRTGAVCRPRPSTTSRIQSFKTSMPVQNTRRKLKNCERP